MVKGKPSPNQPTESEIRVLALIFLENKAIADQLYISEGGVEQHIGKIKRKLGCETRAELAVYATLRGWVKTTEMPSSSKQVEGLNKQIDHLYELLRDRQFDCVIKIGIDLEERGMTKLVEQWLVPMLNRVEDLKAWEDCICIAKRAVHQRRDDEINGTATSPSPDFGGES